MAFSTFIASLGCSSITMGGKSIGIFGKEVLAQFNAYLQHPQQTQTLVPILDCPYEDLAQPADVKKIIHQSIGFDGTCI
jgi:ABC-type cobalamin transport system ATPase subunit